MKILKLRFKNLNSLAGEWEIDFSSQAYSSEGIFAITGPTGAGKSTILDAICLGLYGKTPRLTSITASTNEIMSRKTGSCFAEVLFESQKGLFRTHWSQKRARENAQGRLQSPQFEISDAITGKIIESQLSKTPKVIEEYTGMDFGRFTQAMLLAQGSFAAFLQASEHDRAAMLEDITGTEIYSELSKLAFERHKLEKEKLRELQLKAEEIKTLTEDEISAFELELTQNQAFILQKESLRKELENALAWLQQLAKLQLYYEQLEKEKLANSEAKEVFAPQQEKLDNALKAAELETEFVVLSTHRKELAAHIESRTAITELLPQLKSNSDSAFKTLEDKKQLLAETTKKSEAERQLIKEVREMDVLLGEKQKAVNTVIKSANEAIEQKTIIEKQIQSIDLQIHQSKQRSKAATDYLTSYACDHTLPDEAPSLKLQLSTIASNSLKVASLDSELKQFKLKKQKLEHQQSTLQQNIERITTDHKQLTTQLEELQKELTVLLANRTMDDYRHEFDLLNENLVLHQKIESYEQERLHLQDGKSCPLCGAEHHPFAVGNIPAANATKERIRAINELFKLHEQQSADLRKLEQELQRKASELTLAQAELKIAQNELASLESTIQQKTTEQAQLSEQQTTLIESLHASLQHYNIALSGDWLALSSLISNRLSNWKLHIETKQSIEAEILRFDGDRKTKQALYEEQEKQANKLTYDANVLKKDYDVLKNQRLERFANRNADAAERELDERLRSASEAVVEAQNHFLQADNAIKTNQQRLEELEKNVLALKPQLEKLETAFVETLGKVQFANEEAFKAALLSIDERNSLKAKADELLTQATGIEARLSDTKSRMEIERAKNKTTETIEALQIQINAVLNDVNALSERVGAIRNQLEADRNNRKQHAGLLHEMNLQKAEQEKWAQLDNYIGSADGQKFRRFAQGLTFEIMVRFANEQLSRLTDRYVLMRATDSPLSLTVVDYYQAGEQRTTKNLSGGESFLVSLSLALGLSHMASKNIRIDSLFLDEGFGTLDEDTLETALNTLASMQQDGKLIGVISHISQLKDRINTKITIEKSSNGRSTLSGPGCRRI